MSGRGWRASPHPQRSPHAQLGLLAGISVLTLAAGCNRSGTVVVQNQSGTEFVGEIDGRGIALSGHESIELSFKIGTRVLLFGPDTKDIVFSGEACTRFPFSRIVTVSSGDESVVTVPPDAVCVIIQNQGKFEVREVYQRVHGETDWGANLLDASLFTTEALRRRLAPGRYDFLMIDRCDDSTEVTDGEKLAPGTIRWVTHVAGQDGCIVP